jgi:hypothetical protein
VTSGNSLASYLRPENVLALSEAVQKYGRYPLDIEESPGNSETPNLTRRPFRVK